MSADDCPEIPLQDISFDRDSTLGAGGFASVYKATYNDKPCALKVFPGRTLVKSAKERIRREASVAYTLSSTSKHFIKTYGYVFGRDSNGIVMELAKLSLLDYVRQNKARLFVTKHPSLASSSAALSAYYRQVVKYLLSVAQGIKHMHDNNMLHCDIKPENVLLGQREGEAKLSDFGSTVTVQDVRKLEAKSIVSGTIYYTSPESFSISKEMANTLNTMPLSDFLKTNTTIKTMPLTSTDSSSSTNNNTISVNSTAYSSKKSQLSRGTDIWALGITILQLCNWGDNPYKNITDINMLYHLLGRGSNATTSKGGSAHGNYSFQLEVSAVCPPELLNLAQLCLLDHLEERLSAGQVVQKLQDMVDNTSQPLSMLSYEPSAFAEVILRSCRSDVREYDLQESIEHKNVQVDAEAEAEQKTSGSLNTLDMRTMLQQQYAEIANTQEAVPSHYTEQELPDLMRLLSLLSLENANKARQVEQLREALEQAYTQSLVHQYQSYGEPQFDELAQSVYYEDPRTKAKQYVTLPAQCVNTGKRYTSAGSANGRVVFRGARGGEFYLTEAGNKVYLKAKKEASGGSSSNSAVQTPSKTNTNNNAHGGTPTGMVHQSSGSANGKELYMGPRGGMYYINDGGNKVYKSPEKASTSTTAGSAAATPVKSSTSTSSTAVNAVLTTHRGTPTGMVHQSSGSANGKELYMGPRGGMYYINDGGNKVYKSPEKASTTTTPVRNTTSTSTSTSNNNNSTSYYSTPVRNTSSYSSSSYSTAPATPARTTSSSYISTPSRSTTAATSSGHVSTGRTYTSSGSANGSTLYTGSRGGTYYINSSGNKSYVKR